MTNNNSFDAKVLYSALAKMTNDRAVIKEAFNHWFASLADEPLDIIHVVSELEKYLGLSTPERKVLMVGLHAASGRSEHELADVPAYISGSGSAAASGAVARQRVAPSKPPMVELTEAYCDALLSAMGKIDAKDLAELKDVLKDEGLPNLVGSLNKQIQLTTGDQITLKVDTSESDCQNVCHELYMLVAEFVGPREADIVSDRAMSAILDMTAASRYDPRKLL